ncbi:MAG: SWIM zinc finger family protein [Ilumatobacteraceae bacterium]
MSIVLVPGQFRGEPHPVGKLASTLLSVAVAGMADPARFRRGKTYVAEGAVTRLHVSSGQLLATVIGSSDRPYQVMVAVRPIERPDISTPELLRTQINRLTPEGGELMVSCTCPDDADPCKHAVAALLAFAAELVSRPELVVELRCVPADGEAAPARAQVGSRARPSERHLRLAPAIKERVRAPEPPAPWENDEWVQFLGALPPEAPDVPPEPAVVRRAMLGTIDLGAWVQSAIDELSSLD